VKTMMVGSLEVPQIVTSTIGKGRVVYFNACHHNHTSDALSLWTYEVFDPDPRFLLSHELYDVIEHSSEQGLSGLGFLAMMLFPDVDTEFSHRRVGLGFVEHYTGLVHRRTASTTLRHLFPTPQDYLSLTRAQRLALCRGLLNFLWLMQEGMEGTPVGLQERSTYPDFDESWRERARQLTPQFRGEMFEDFVACLLLTIPGMRITDRRLKTSTGEIDLVLAYEGADRFWLNLGSRIPVECKFTAKPLSAAQLRSFAGKTREFAARTGILVSLNGISGVQNRNCKLLLRDYMREGLNIISLDKHDIVRCTHGLTMNEVVRLAQERPIR
jgi:hypothetical protein